MGPRFGSMAHLPQAVAEEPRGFVIRTEHPLKLLGAHTLLAGRHELSSQNPFAKRNLAPLHHSADSHGKGFAAFLALVNTGCEHRGEWTCPLAW